MQVVVAVLTEEHDDVLPSAGIAVGLVVYNLVDQNLSLALVGYREPSHAHVLLVGVRDAVVAATLSVVEQREPSVVNITVYVTVGILALIAQQVVVGIEALGV